MNVYWTESALADLEAVEAHVGRHSSQYARSLVARIFAKTEQLRKHSRLGPIVPEFEDDATRELFEDPYRIVYRIDADRIHIVAVVHAARRLPRGF